MKKIKLNTNPLKLAKEEISNLSSSELKQIVGGNPVASFLDCTTDCPVTQLMGCVHTMQDCPAQTSAPGCVVHSIPASGCIIIK